MKRIVNDDQQDSGTPQLLALPADVLKKILRFNLVENAPICVAADHPEESNEGARGILSTCHAIRNLARPIFYRENDFEVQIFECDIKAVMPWLKVYNAFAEQATMQEAKFTGLAQPALKISLTSSAPIDGDITMDGSQYFPAKQYQFTTEHKDPPATFASSYNRFLAAGASMRQVEMLHFAMIYATSNSAASPFRPGHLYVVTKFDPHWCNLVEWLKLFHNGEVASYAYSGDNGRADLVLSGVFDLAQVNKDAGRQWSAFEQCLPPLRRILGGYDDRWLPDVSMSD